MMFAFGPRAQRVYAALRQRILSGELAPGTRLPSHLELAEQYEVAPLTLRRVLAVLEEDGLVSREPGRGTFVRAPAVPAVLIVEDDVLSRRLVGTYVTRAGYRPVEAAGPAEGLAALERDPGIAFVLTDVRMPDRHDGIGFIRVVRTRWPEVPVAAVTAYPEDLTELHGRPECPLLILAKPVPGYQIEEALKLVLGRPRRSGAAAPAAVG